MYHLLHFHFEASLRALEVVDPESVNDVRSLLLSQPAGQSLLPYQQLEVCDQLTTERANTKEVYNACDLRVVVDNLAKELHDQRVEHVDIRLPIFNNKWSGVSDLRDVRCMFDAASVRYGVTFSFVGALNFTANVQSVTDNIAAILNDKSIQDNIAAVDINLLPKDIGKLAKFTSELTAIRSLGIKANLHLGELFPNSYSKEILRLVKPNRIGHGVLLIDDGEVVRYLKDNDICLDMCPISNTRLGVVDWTKDNPAKRALKLGVAVTINTDDPKLFGTTIEDDLQLAALDKSEMRQVINNSIKYSYR